MRVIDKPFLRSLLRRALQHFDLSATNNVGAQRCAIVCRKANHREGMNIENKTNLDHPRETEASGGRRFATEEVKRCVHSVWQPWD